MQTTASSSPSLTTACTPGQAHAAGRANEDELPAGSQQPRAPAMLELKDAAQPVQQAPSVRILHPEPEMSLQTSGFWM